MQKERVLVIDDEDIILQLSKEILTKSNYEVETLSDSKKAIQLLESAKFDLLLTDIRMPEIDGIEVIRNIRKNNREMPIIVFTGHGTLDVAINALRLGAQGFLLKPFTPDELLSAIEEALEKTRLLNENIRMRAIMPLFEVSKQIIGETDIKKLLKLIIDIAVKETGSSRAFLCLINAETGKMTEEEDYGLSPVFQKKIREGYGEKIAQIIFQKQKPFLVNPNAMVLLGLEEIVEEEKGASSIYMPLSVRGNNIGILYLSRSRRKVPFTPSEVELVSVLSGQAAVAIENAHLYKKLDQSYLSTIITLSSVAEARDHYTDRHMKDIAEHSVKIARKIGLPESYIEDIRKAALLHDLGKVSVPDNILMKKGKLTKEEIAIIQKHPFEGVRMIEFIEPLSNAKEIIKHHHEFFDGSGYPDGIKGEKIPVGARIVAIADAFGAMTTDRPYRKALSVDEAVRELRENAGSQFDPQFVDIFISILQEKDILKHVST